MLSRKSACSPEQPSQAEELAALAPGGVVVVKALNTVSAYQVGLLLLLLV